MYFFSVSLCLRGRSSLCSTPRSERAQDGVHRRTLRRVGGEAEERFEVLRHLGRLPQLLIRQPGVVVAVGEVRFDLDAPAELGSGVLEVVLAARDQARLVMREGVVAVG